MPSATTAKSLGFQAEPSHSEKFRNAIQEIQEKIQDVRNRLIPIQESIENDELKTSGGVSILEVKYHTLISYLTNYSFYLLLKLHGQKIEKHPVVDKLIQGRVYLEKMKPLESKLKYQIDKVIKASSMADDANMVTSHSVIEAQHPLVFKPNPLYLLDKDGERNEDSDGGNALAFNSNLDADSNGVYQPPKIAPAYFEEIKTSSKGKLSAHAKERASKSRLLNELRSQYDERPEELTAHGTGYGSREIGNEMDDKWAERERFEEENFVRLNMTREDKKLRKLIEKKGNIMRFQDEFDNLDADFRDLSGLSKAVEKEEESSSRKSNFIEKRNLSSTLNQNKNTINGGKRKFQDVEQLISSNADARKYKNTFNNQIKKMKRKSTLQK